MKINKVIITENNFKRFLDSYLLYFGSTSKPFKEVETKKRLKVGNN